MSLLIGTTAGAFLFDETPKPLIEGTRVNHIIRDAESWWAVDGKRQIYHEGEVVATLPVDAIPLCIEPTPDTIWIGANQARLFGIDHGKLEEDEFFANAPGRDSWYTPWGAPADVRSMTLDVDHTLYVNVHVGGILRYDNTGVVPTLDIDADVHQVAAHPIQKGAVFAACAHGLAASHNGHDFEIRADGLHASYCRAVAVLPDQVLVSASTGPSTSQGRLYRGGLWEGSFEPLTTGLPDWFEGNLNTHCITVKEDGVYVGFGSTVWHSADGGDSWAEVASGLPQITCIG